MKITVVVAVALLLAGITACQEICDKNNKFCFPNVVATWSEAVRYCAQKGWRLAVVNSENKQRRIENLANKLDAVKSGKVELWIGASDQAEEGCFVWEANKKPVKYANWMRGMPDNRGGQENCVHLWYEKAKNYNWVWNDVVCSSKRRFICERKKV